MCRHSQAPPNFKFQDSHLETPSPRQSPWSTTPPSQRAGYTSDSHTVTRQPSRCGARTRLGFQVPSVQPLNVQNCAKLGTNLQGHFSFARLTDTCLRARSAASPVSIAPHPLFKFSTPPTLRIYEQWIIPQRMRPVPVDSLRPAMAPAIGVWQTLRRHVSQFPKTQSRRHPLLLDNPLPTNIAPRKYRLSCTSSTARAARQTHSSSDHAPSQLHNLCPPHDGLFNRATYAERLPARARRSARSPPSS